ncbi:MAG: hypothetical protein JEZ06_06345 [Anaerolineaceae bacterium]|nr:hypothetical protein [Anaerolineaceae bacterium]
MFFLLFFARNKIGFFKAFLVALVVLLGSSVWLIPVLGQHGLEPFQSVIHLSEHSLTTIWLMLVPSLGEEQNITLFTVFAIIGAFLCIREKKLFLVLWFMVPILIETRSADGYSIIALALLSGIGINAVLVKVVSSQKKESTTWASIIAENGIIKLMLGYILFLSMISAFTFSLLESAIHLQDDHLSAMQWIQENTYPDAKFITLTGTNDSFTDPVLEWFPALTKRYNINTLQGREWTIGSDFTHFQDSLDTMQNCLNQDIQCLDSWASHFNQSYDHIFIQRKFLKSNTVNHSSLELDLFEDNRFDLIFQNDSILIFERI